MATPPWWVELIGAIIVAIPGILALVSQSKIRKAEAKKLNSESDKTDADRENELIEISRKASAGLITQLENRITSLTGTVQTLYIRCDGYEKRIDEQEEEIKILKDEIAIKNKRIDELERSEKQKDERIRQLEARVAELESVEKKL